MVAWASAGQEGTLCEVFVSEIRLIKPLRISVLLFYKRVSRSERQIAFQTDSAPRRIFARLSSGRVCFPTAREAFLSLGGDYLIAELN